MWCKSIIAGGLLLCSFFCMAIPAQAAAQSDDRTVLYYLMEVQRQRGTPCPGSVKSALPNLVPSDSLAAMAREVSRTGDPVESVKTLFELAPEDAVFSTTVSAPTAQAALNQIKSASCPDVMSGQYVFVGAAKQGNIWTVMLSGRNPVFPPGLPGSGGADDASGSAGMASSASPAGANGQSAAAEEYASEEAAPPPLLAAPPPVPVAPPKPRVGVTPLADDPVLPPQAPLSYVAPGAAEPGITGGTDASSAAAGRNAAGRPGATILLDRDGKSIPVVIVGETAENLPDGGMVIDKNAREGFSGEASSDFMMEGRGKGVSSAPALQGDVSVETRPAQPSSAALIAVTSAEARSMFDLINERRRSGQLCGSTLRKAQPLRLSTSLTGVAQAHADDMGSRGYFSSTSPDGAGVGDRLATAGYAWNKAGETIAVASPPAGDALQQWLGNATQCDTLMNADLKEVGIGFAPSYNIWVVTLADPGM